MVGSKFNFIISAAIFASTVYFLWIKIKRNTKFVNKDDVSDDKNREIKSNESFNESPSENNESCEETLDESIELKDDVNYISTEIDFEIEKIDCLPTNFENAAQIGYDSIDDFSDVDQSSIFLNSTHGITAVTSLNKSLEDMLCMNLRNININSSICDSIVETKTDENLNVFNVKMSTNESGDVIDEYICKDENVEEQIFVVDTNVVIDDINNVGVPVNEIGEVIESSGELHNIEDNIIQEHVEINKMDNSVFIDDREDGEIVEESICIENNTIEELENVAEIKCTEETANETEENLVLDIETTKTQSTEVHVNDREDGEIIDESICEKHDSEVIQDESMENTTDGDKAALFEESICKNDEAETAEDESIENPLNDLEEGEIIDESICENHDIEMKKGESTEYPIHDREDIELNDECINVNGDNVHTKAEEVVLIGEPISETNDIEIIKDELIENTTNVREEVELIDEYICETHIEIIKDDSMESAANGDGEEAISDKNDIEMIQDQSIEIATNGDESVLIEESVCKNDIEMIKDENTLSDLEEGELIDESICENNENEVVKEIIENPTNCQEEEGILESEKHIEIIKDESMENITNGDEPQLIEESPCVINGTEINTEESPEKPLNDIDNGELIDNSISENVDIETINSESVEPTINDMEDGKLVESVHEQIEMIITEELCNEISPDLLDETDTNESDNTAINELNNKESENLDATSDISRTSDYHNDSSLDSLLVGGSLMEYIEDCLSSKKSDGSGEIECTKLENWPNDDDCLNNIKRDFYDVSTNICSPHPSSESDHAHCVNNLTERVAILSAESILDSHGHIHSSDSERTPTLSSPSFDDCNPELYVEKITYGDKEMDIVYFDESVLEEGGVQADIKIVRTIPVGIGGRIIGKKGKTKNELMKKFGAQLLIYNHPDEIGKQVLQITCNPSVSDQLERWVNKTLEQITKNTIQTTVSHPEWLKPMIPLGRLVAAHVVDMSTIQHIKLRIYDPDIIKAYSTMQREMNADYGSGDNTSILPRPVAIGCVCVAMIRPDYFLRAQIVEICDDIAQVYLFDIGKVCQTYLFYLFKIREKYMRVPFQVIPARLPHALMKNKNISPSVIHKRFLCDQKTMKPKLVRVFFPRMNTCCEPCVNIYVPMSTVSNSSSSGEFIDLLELLVSMNVCSMVRETINSEIQVKINSNHFKAFLNEKEKKQIANITVPLYFQPCNSKFYEDFVEFKLENETN